METDAGHNCITGNVGRLQSGSQIKRIVILKSTDYSLLLSLFK